MSITRRVSLAVATSAALLAVPGGALAQPAPLTIFAAASMKNALDAAAALWASRTGKPAPRISYAASNTLAKQIEQGAPADVFVSADLDWMDYLDTRKLIRAGSRVDLLGNRLVLVAPKDALTPIVLGPGLDLARALGSGRLAMGNVDAVPAGKYGKAALEKLGAWDGVKDRIAQADSVRAALLLVSRGEANLGIVYATDAVAEPNVVVVGTFPADSHPSIVYPVALVRDSTNPDGADFLTFMRGGDARPIFQSQGFTVLNRPHSGS